MQLKKATLGALAATGKVSVPSYDAAKDLQPGILHIGVGNFFRAHLAKYLDDLFEHELEESRPWGVIGAGVTNGGYTKRRQILQEQQDLLYTTVERDGQGVTARVMGPLLDLLPYADDFAPIAKQMLNPDIHIVSTCITEGGYYLNPSSGKLDTTDAKIQHDITCPVTGEAPQTVIGLLVQALQARRKAGMTPFTVLCCDNIPHNGDTTRQVVVDLARLQDADLADWIEQNVKFPNSMVDRITPATGDKERQYCEEHFGVSDATPVFCEPFCQWVVEDDFVNNVRPAFDKVGVQFVEDVTPYELSKLRVLNGGHASLCYPSALLGLEYVHEAMDHPVISKFLDALERHELVPSCPPLPDGTCVAEYWKTIATRFSNPTINDRIDRNCADGADRQPKFIIPALQENLKQQPAVSVDGLATVSALWCRYCLGTTEAGETIPRNDKVWDKLHQNAKTALHENKPDAWLGMKEIYGEAGQDSNFRQAFTKALELIQTQGVEAAMMAYVNQVDGNGGTANGVDKENNSNNNNMAVLNQ